jgi:hypothetical protein
LGILVRNEKPELCSHIVREKLLSRFLLGSFQSSDLFLELPDLGISERFSSLDSLMCKKVEYEEMGFDEVQKFFGVKQNLRGIVRCVQ